MGELFKLDITGLCITDAEPTYNFEHKLYHKMGNEASIRENEILVWTLAKCSKTPQKPECNNFHNGWTTTIYLYFNRTVWNTIKSRSYL